MKDLLESPMLYVLSESQEIGKGREHNITSILKKKHNEGE